jgi:hypothetical protein
MPPQNEDTILPAGRFNVAPFGPTGVINNNSLDTVGQGLKKVFAQPFETPRQFTTKFETSQKGNPTADGDGNNYIFSEISPLSMSVFSESFEL